MTTACAYCGESEDKRRFIVQGKRPNARICDTCLCMYATHVVHERGLPAPPGIAKLGMPRPYAEWPLERSLRRVNFVYWRARARLRAQIRSALRKTVAKPASPLATYFVRPSVSPLAQFERVCAFCGTRSGRLYGRAARICEPCVEQVAQTMLG